MDFLQIFAHSTCNTKGRFPYLESEMVKQMKRWNSKLPIYPSGLGSNSSSSSLESQSQKTILRTKFIPLSVYTTHQAVYHILYLVAVPSILHLPVSLRSGKLELVEGQTLSHKLLYVLHDTRNSILQYVDTKHLLIMVTLLMGKSPRAWTTWQCIVW